MLHAVSLSYAQSNSITCHRLFDWAMLKAINSITLLLLLLLNPVGSARLRESDIHPISPKTLAPQYHPIDKKKRKGKIVEDYNRDRAA